MKIDANLIDNDMKLIAYISFVNPKLQTTS
jgi:hypothetical protein